MRRCLWYNFLLISMETHHWIGSSHDILWLGFAFWIVWRWYLWWGFLLVAKLFLCIPHVVEQKTWRLLEHVPHVVPSTPGKSSNRVWISLLCEYWEEDTARGFSKTYRWMLDGKDSRTYIKSDLKGWRHRPICFFGAFDRLFDVSATHYDVFSYTIWCVSLWGTRYQVTVTWRKDPI